MDKYFIIIGLDENIPNGEIFTHKFENMWILTEQTELRSSNGRKWYADGAYYFHSK